MRVKTGNRALFVLAGFVLAGLALAGCANEINSPYVQVQELTLDHTTVMVRASESVTLHAALNPVNATNQKVKWVSDNEQIAVAAIDPADTSGLTAVITGKKLGSAVIRVIAEDSNGAVYAAASVQVVESVPVSGITLNRNGAAAAAFEMLTGSVQELEAVIAPANASDKTLTWTSSETGAVTVTGSGSAASITAAAPGTAVITAASTADPSKTASVTVTVRDQIHVVSLALSADGVTLSESFELITGGAAKTLAVTVAPANADDQTVAWVSDHPEFATVTQGADNPLNAAVSPVSPGQAVITVTSADGAKTAQVRVTVRAPVAVESVILQNSDGTDAGETLALETGSNYTLKAAIAPPNADNKVVSWVSNADTVATVTPGDNGTAVINAIGPGTTVITVTTADGGKTDGVTVTVTNPVSSIPVTGVTLNQTALALGIGETGSLTATIDPGNATNGNVTWASSAPAVATVTGSGATATITAVGPGTAAITVTSVDNAAISATATVTVGYKLVIKTFKDGDLNIETTPNTAVEGVVPSYPLEIQNADGGSFGNAAGTFLNNMTLAYFAAPAAGDFSLTAKVKITGGGSSGNQGFWAGALINAPGITNAEAPFLTGIRHVAGSSGAVRRLMRTNNATATLRADNLQSSFAKAIGTEYRYVISREGQAYTLTMTNADGNETFGTNTLNPSSETNGIHADLSVDGQTVYLGFIVANNTIEISGVEFTLGD